ncbi:MAG: polyprenyl synthetase family protein [Eubacterium sp.]
MNNFENQLKERTEYVQNIIYKFCPKEEGLQKIIIEAVNYSLRSGGKRLRPMLILETLRLFEGDELEAYPFMAAMEMIHTYSLVHDDLPAMDNDMYRRGRKTTHAVYGEAMGILAGDGLLNLAYEVMSEGVVNSKNPVSAAKAMKIIAAKAGIYGMIGGQTVDVFNEGKKIDIDTIQFIHKLKTAALIEGSMMAGAVLAGATEDQVKIIEEIAYNVGIAFQIQDDILDVTSTMEVLGKPVHSDEKNNKSTYVTLMGIEESKKQVESYSHQAVTLLECLDYNNEFLKRLIVKLMSREK